MSAFAQLKSPAGSEESGEGGPAPAAAAAASVAAAPAGQAGAAAATSAAAAASCTLVAKWQGSTIELPVLPSSTTIGEVKVGAMVSAEKEDTCVGGRKK
ncbi:unnamed protein product [Ectocarpus sp. 4 AP-2014]